MLKYLANNPSNHIIHFTSSFKKLSNIILSNSLILSYCKEEFTIENDLTVSKAVHPMVSFSEQNINNLKEKTITYGKYGLSFNNNWIVKNKIQPVIYIDKNSSVAKSLGTLLSYRRRKTKKNNHSLLRLPIITIKCFTKNAVGFNSHFEIPNFDFKSENEWRYVPTKPQIGGGYISETISTYESKKHIYNSKIEKHPLYFNPDDIKLIFVNSEEDKKNLIEQFKIETEKIKISEWKEYKKETTNA